MTGADALRIVEWDWRPIRGDTERTIPVSVVTRAGVGADLSGWTIRAQIRDRADEVVHTFARPAGILLGAAAVTLRDPATGRDLEPVTAATVALRLLPGDWPAIPRRLAGARYDVEVSRGDVVRTVLRGAFEPEGDTTR